MKRLFPSFMLASFIVLGFWQASPAQMWESYEEQGTFKWLKGRLMWANRDSIPFGSISIKNIATEEIFSVNVREDGFFKKTDLSSGRYLIEVRSNGANPSNFTVTIDRQNPDASKMYFEWGLSPGCSSGGFLEKVSKLKPAQITK